MKLRLVFLLDLVGTYLAFAVLAALFIWPRLIALPKPEALRLLILPHIFRFIGLSFLFPGVVSPQLPSRAAVPAAWGDVGASILALISIAALTLNWSFAIPLVWIFNLWGTIDLLDAYYQAISIGVNPGLFGAAFFIPTFLVPLLLTSHVMTFMMLLR